MFNKILVPTDFSKQAEDALQVAAILAKRYDAEIYLLHMLELPLQLVDGGLSNSNTSQLPEALFFMKLAHQKFQTMMSQPFLEGITVHEKAEFDGAFEGIMDYAQQYNADLIVMGSSGGSNTKGLLVGSNTEKVVRYANIPVLIIKDTHESFKVKKLVYACNFEEENLKAYRRAIEFAEHMKIPIHMLYVNTPSKFKTTPEIERMMLDFLSHERFTNYTLNVQNDNTIQDGIINFAEKMEADLVGIATHGRKGLAHFFNGSLSESYVSKSKRPVVTFKIA